MALSDKRIIDEMEKGHIVITPFSKENLSTSSYDVALGEYYFEEQRPDTTKVYKIYNPYSKKAVDRVWGVTPLQAERAETVLGDTFPFDGITKNDKVILVPAGATILAHTEEFIGGVDHITTMMKARSSLGRNFIEVCKCAGWGDVGYINRWTMEITNNSRYYAIPLVVGRRIGQIIFFNTGAIRASDYAGSGKYQTTTDLQELQKMWRPDMMLPKMYNDREVQK